MSGAADRDAVWQSLNIAFYALTEMLEQGGMLDQSRLADEIARFDPGDREILRANLEGIMATLRTRPFKPATLSLQVVEGGKADDARHLPLAPDRD